MKEEQIDSTEISCQLQDSRSDSSAVEQTTLRINSTDCNPHIAPSDHCNNRSNALNSDMARSNKVSMENLVPEPSVAKIQRSKRIWQLVSVVACTIAVVMIALFIWQLASRPASDSFTQKKRSSSPESWPAKELCPQLPPLLKLPSPLPGELTTSLEHIDDYIKRLVNPDSHLPAISASIFYQDKIIWTRHYGRKKRDEPALPDDNTHYRIGSITKIFPVIMIYKMYEEGLIDSLDDSLSKYAPDFHINNPFTGENITLRQIASQLSGLPREAPCAACMKNETTASQTRLLRNRSLVVEPGTRPSYSNLGYALLGRLLTERPTVNTTFEAWVQDNILIPLGLNNTGFQITKDVQHNMAFPYNRAGAELPFMDIGWLGPAGQMYSTIADMAKLGMYLIGAKKQSVLKMNHLREMLAPANIAPDGQTLWGSPWEMVVHKHLLVRSKGGAIDSYAAMLSLVPEVQLGFTAFVSTVHNFTEGALIANTMMDYVYRSFLPVFNTTLFALNEGAKFPVDTKMYIGTYNVTELDEISGSYQSYQASISPSGSALVYRKGEAIIYYLRYIGQRFVLQGKRPPATCIIEQLGSIADFYFVAVNSDGLSPSFAVPCWGLQGVRVSETDAGKSFTRRTIAESQDVRSKTSHQDSDAFISPSTTGPLGLL